MNYWLHFRDWNRLHLLYPFFVTSLWFWLVSPILHDTLIFPVFWVARYFPTCLTLTIKVVSACLCEMLVLVYRTRGGTSEYCSFSVRCPENVRFHNYFVRVFRENTFKTRWLLYTPPSSLFKNMNFSHTLYVLCVILTIGCGYISNNNRAVFMLETLCSLCCRIWICNLFPLLTTNEIGVWNYQTCYVFSPFNLWTN